MGMSERRTALGRHSGAAQRNPESRVPTQQETLDVCDVRFSFDTGVLDSGSRFAIPE